MLSPLTSSTVLAQNVPDYDFEHSELLLYHLHLLEGLEQYDNALDKLDIWAKDRSIVDRTSIQEYRGEL